MIVKNFTEEFPRCGKNMIGQIIRRKGHAVQRFRLRESLHRVDAAGKSERSRHSLHRRVYDVGGQIIYGI